MKKMFLYISIVLHIVIAIISLFRFDIFPKKTIKDNGHAVFDFVSIGNKSTAPILSNDNGKASKIKSYNNDTKDDNTINKQNNNIAKTIENKNDSIKKDNKKINKQNNKNETKDKIDQTNKLQNKKPIPKHLKDNSDKKEHVTKLKSNKKPVNKDTKNVNKKQTNKSNGRALVNLNKKNKKVLHTDIANKKLFNSFLDNVLADGENENTGANAESLGDTLTATQVDQVRNTIRKCWHFPAGLKDAETLVVDIKMELDRNGYVKKAEVVDKNRMKRDSGFKIAAENAQRAVLDQRCNPLPLPKEKYEEWKDLELSFNPKDML